MAARWSTARSPPSPDGRRVRASRWPTAGRSRARRLLVTTGLVDELPDCPGCASAGAGTCCTARTATAGRSATSDRRAGQRPDGGAPGTAVPPAERRRDVLLRTRSTDGRASGSSWRPAGSGSSTGRSPGCGSSTTGSPGSPGRRHGVVRRDVLAVASRARGPSRLPGRARPAPSSTRWGWARTSPPTRPDRASRGLARRQRHRSGRPGRCGRRGGCAGGRPHQRRPGRRGDRRSSLRRRTGVSGRLGLVPGTAGFPTTDGIAAVLARTDARPHHRHRQKSLADHAAAV